MEYVEGVTLSALIKRDGASPPTRRHRWAHKAADALGGTAVAGIVHRDVEPVHVAEGWQVKLSDFGMAHTQADASLTQTGPSRLPRVPLAEVASGGGPPRPPTVGARSTTPSRPHAVRRERSAASTGIVHEEPHAWTTQGWLTPCSSTMTRDPAARLVDDPGP